MKTDQVHYSILVVDDIASIRMAISDYLSPDYRVIPARDAKEAIDALQTGSIDFLLSDIRMPGMSGLDLIAFTKEKWPEVHTALMTAYNVNDYIRFARENQIYNIIPKSTFLDLKFIGTMIQKILSGKIFGISHYLRNVKTEFISLAGLHKLHRNINAENPEYRFQKDTNYIFAIETAGEKDTGCDQISELLIHYGGASILRQVIEELASNAMTHGNGKMYLGFGISGETVFFRVLDMSGTLNRDEILMRLERNVTLDDQGLPISLQDSRGRGLFISRENVDQLIFNIAPDRYTEVIALLNIDEAVRTRAVSMYQSDRDVPEMLTS